MRCIAKPSCIVLDANMACDSGEQYPDYASILEYITKVAFMNRAQQLLSKSLKLLLLVTSGSNA